MVECSISELGAGQVRTRVEACGVCHADAATLTGIYQGFEPPRVPGHEVDGRVEALRPLCDWRTPEVRNLREANSPTSP